MKVAYLEEAVELLEKANADLEPELTSVPEAKEGLEVYARLQRLAGYGIAALAGRIDNAASLAQVTRTSIGQAKDTVATGKVLKEAPELGVSLQQGDISLEQATEIARAEESAPGSAAGLLEVAQEQPFHVLRERSRKVKLEAEQHRGLAEKQRAARSARSYSDALGMVHFHMAFEPHVGTRIVARAEAEAQRLARAAKKNGALEPFERHLADGYAKIMTEGGKGPARRPEVVVLVDHSVVKRGWKDVHEGEVCKIPGVGPVSPQVAREIAKDAFLNGVFFDGKDLRNFVRYGKHIPVEVLIALELGDPPDFDGVACVDCGNRFRTEFDHVDPRASHGPTCTANIDPRCWSCHQEKTKRDRKAGKLRPQGPDTG
jgi:5-methylcytosine-specific restriction endonuclease McrA